MAAKRPPPPRALSEPVRLGGLDSFTVDIKSLHAASIRWFYCEPGKGWLPFNGRDSLSMEDARMHVDNSDDINLSQEVVVMGDLYTVEIYKNSASLKPIYWDIKEPWTVRRGTWFEVVSKDQWQPLPEEESVIIEEAHTRRDWREKAKADIELSVWAQSRRSSLQPQQQSTVILYQVMLNGYEVVWLGENEILKVKKDLASRMLSKVGEKLGKGLSYGSTKLIRGYKEPSLYSDSLPDIGHLVFAIHGIGQNMESSDIIKSTADLRETCNTIAKKHFPDQWKKKRVEFIPIEWRTWLTLDRGILSSITPHSVKSLRNIINDSVLDIMYYMSPKYGPEILDGFRWQLNKKYKEFIRRHPNFIQNGGSVSLFGHSLGSVMCYDLLIETCQAKGLLKKQPLIKTTTKTTTTTECIEEDDTDCVDDDNLKQFEELHRAKLRVAELEEKLLRKKSLDFNVDHFFAVGSPLGIFIILKEHDGHVKRDYKGAESFLPSCMCSRIHNLHHPSDPVAYRIEPLINPLYSQIKPVKVDSAGSKPSQKSKDLAEGPRPEDSSPPSSRGWFNYVTSSVIKNLGSTPVTDQPTRLPDNKMFDDDSKLKPEERLQERLDFMLRESMTENSYLNSLTAHLCYWTSNDTALYLLLQIYTYQNKSKI